MVERSALQTDQHEIDCITSVVPAKVAGVFYARSDKPILRISRWHHGNIKSAVITHDFVHCAEYKALTEAAAHAFRGPLARMRWCRGEGDKPRKERERLPVGDEVADIAGGAVYLSSTLQGTGHMMPSSCGSPEY